MTGTYTLPEGGFKSLPSITDIYTKSLQLVYPAARDIAKELDGYASSFAERAKARIDELIGIAQKLRWEKEKLEREAEEARQGTADALQTIHTFLTGNKDMDDLRNYRQGEEEKADENPPIQTPPPSPPT